MADGEKPRAYTAEEVREIFLDQIWAYVGYWDSQAPDKAAQVSGRKMTQRERLSGLAFSILNIFDGNTLDLPALDIIVAASSKDGKLPAFKIVPSPHPEDEEFHKAEGENWFPKGVVINDTQLHELMYAGRFANRRGT